MARKTIQNIADVKGMPVVGRAYLVPCVWVTGFKMWAPVLGPEHDDKEIIGLAIRHWHYDVRFLPEHYVEELQLPDDPRPATALSTILNSERTIGPTELRRRVCRRQMPDFPFEYVNYRGEAKRPDWANALEDAYASHHLKPDCRVCPHRGVPLNGLPVRKGVVVCPGHGLAWNTKTGEMVRRTVSP